MFWTQSQRKSFTVVVPYFNLFLFCIPLFYLPLQISDVADHFTGMLQLVIKARGNTNNSNVVQDVLRQAQTMAVLLSSLMRSINMMQNYKQVGNRIVI